MRAVFILAFFGIFTAVLGQLENDLEKQSTSLFNHLVDLALERFSLNVSEPLPLRDEVLNYTEKVLFIRTSGYIAVYEGKLWGLKNIKRSGDAHVITQDYLIDAENQLNVYDDADNDGDSHKVMIKCNFLLDDITFKYNFDGKLMRMHPKGVITGRARETLAEVEIQVHFLEKKVTLVEAKVLNIKEMTVKLYGEKYMDSVVNYIVKVFTNLFKNTIVKVLDKEIANVLKGGIDFTD